MLWTIMKVTNTTYTKKIQLVLVLLFLFGFLSIYSGTRLLRIFEYILMIEYFWTNIYIHKNILEFRATNIFRYSFIEFFYLLIGYNTFKHFLSIRIFWDQYKYLLDFEATSILWYDTVWDWTQKLWPDMRYFRFFSCGVKLILQVVILSFLCAL